MSVRALKHSLAAVPEEVLLPEHVAGCLMQSAPIISAKYFCMPDLAAGIACLCDVTGVQQPAAKLPQDHRELVALPSRLGTVALLVQVAKGLAQTLEEC